MLTHPSGGSGLHLRFRAEMSRAAYGADGASPCPRDVAVGRGERDLAAGVQTGSLELPHSFSVSFHSSLLCLGIADTPFFS